jgi:hypothetical protein
VTLEEEILRFKREGEELEMRCAVDFVVSAGSRITKAELSRKRGRTEDKVAEIAGVLAYWVLSVNPLIEIVERMELTTSKHRLPVAKDAIRLPRIELYGSGRM